MTPFATQFIVVAVGLCVLGIAVHKRSRVAACVCLGLLLTFGSISGAVFYEQPGEAAASNSLANQTERADGFIFSVELQNVVNRDSTTAQEPADSATTSSATTSNAALVDSDAEDHPSDKKAEDATVALDKSGQPVTGKEPVGSLEADGKPTRLLDTATSTRNANEESSEGADTDVVPSNRSFIPLNGEEVPASVGSYVAGTPEWVLKGDYEAGNHDYRLVTAGPSYRLRDCEKELNALLIQTTNEYIDDWLEPGASKYVEFDLRYVKNHLLVDGKRFSQLREYQVGPMHSSYAQLDFDQSFREQTSEQWRNVKAKHRLIHTGLIGGSVLALLVTVFGYFRLDHATRGLHTGRLQFLAGAAILTLVLSGAIAWRAIPWL